MNGLVSFKSASQIHKEETEAAYKAEAQENEYSEQVKTNLASHIRKVWQTNRDVKVDVYKRLLDCLRARKGEYSDWEKAQIAQQGGADPVYLRLTGTKSRAAASWIRDILLPVKDRPWELDPTPIPELPDDVKESALRSVLTQIQAMAQQGMVLNQDDQIRFTDMVKDKVLMQLTDVANMAIKNIERKIDDAMVDGQFRKAMEEFIEDFVTYPFAVIKGPYYQPKVYLEWKNGKPTPTTQNVLCWRRVSPFDIFYSPYCSNIQEGDLIERLRYSSDQLYRLLGQDGFRDDEIRAVLEEHSNLGLNDWIWEDFEKERLESNSTYFLADKNTIDGLHFWGYVKGIDLLDWGYDPKKVDDPLKMYPVDAILIGRHVVRCVINDNPMGHRPYHSACWDAVPGSLVGIGLPEQMADHQKIVNATARSLVTNLSISSGPQAVILTDMLATGEDITNIHPFKIWQMKSSITGNSGKPVEFFQPDSNAQELLTVLSQFENKADDVTNVPRYSYGNEKVGGAGSTATGLSMLMNSAAKGIRRAIANIDLNIMQPTIYQTFVEIMLKDPDPTIRGDVKVIARGSAAVLIKEQMLENQKEFLQITTNEMDIGIIGKKGRARLLASIANNLNIDPLVLPTDQELDLREQQERAMAEQQAQAEMAATMAQSQPQQGGPSPEELAELQQQAMAVEQQSAQLEKAQAAVDLKDKMVQKQAMDVQSELKKLKQVQKQLEDQMASLAMERIELDKQKAQSVADIEKAKISLEMEAEQLKALANKVKLISATKEDETEKEGKETEKKEAKEASAQATQAINDALSQVTEAMKLLSAPKQINVQRDEGGKITGATAKPVTAGLKAE